MNLKYKIKNKGKNEQKRMSHEEYVRQKKMFARAKRIIKVLHIPGINGVLLILNISMYEYTEIFSMKQMDILAAMMSAQEKKMRKRAGKVRETLEKYHCEVTMDEAASRVDFAFAGPEDIVDIVRNELKHMQENMIKQFNGHHHDYIVCRRQPLNSEGGEKGK